MTLRPFYQWLLLTAIVLGVYYPAIFGGFIVVDDAKLISHLSSLESFDFSKLFLRSGGYYYRPLTAATFVADQLLWGAQPLIMHVENLLLHALNTTLVFLLARRLLGSKDNIANALPMLAAALFALHPVNSEAVCWISGRFDLLATTCVLGSTWLLLRALDGTSPWRMLPAIFLALLGCLAKETALFFFGGAVCLLLVRSREETNRFWASTCRALPGILLWSGAALLYLSLRRWALSGRDSGVGTVFKSVAKTDGALGWVDQLRVVLKVSGFYLKKIFFPYPLNFAITEISDLYVGLGCLLLFCIVWLVWRLDLAAGLFLAAILTASSALLVVLGKMAWTLLAERYLYMPTAFFVLGWVTIAATWPHGWIRWFKLAAVAVVVFYGALTVQRAHLWSDPVKLFEDTVSKSPDFPPTRKDLANYYLAAGRVAEGKQLLEGIMAQPQADQYVIDDFSMANQLAREGRLEEAHDILTAAIGKAGKQYAPAVRRLVELNYKRLDRVSDGDRRLEIRRENVRLLEELNRRSRDPFNDYLLGKEYLALNERERARALFESAFRNAPAGGHYKESARKLAEKLSTGTSD